MYLFGTSPCFIQSYVSGLHLVESVQLPVAARVALNLLPAGLLWDLGEEVSALFKRCKSMLLRADSGATGFGDGAVGVVVEMAASDG